MSKQKNILLLGLLLLQVALVIFMYRPNQNTGAPEVQLFEKLNPAEVTAMTISDGDGKSITLQKVSEEWQVGPRQYPGDAENISKIFTKISVIKSSRLITKTKSSHVRLKVADETYDRKIVIVSPGGEVVFYIGTAPSSKSVHLRKAGDNEVYQVADLSSWEIQPDDASWWQSKYVKVSADDLTGFTLNNAHGKVAFSKDDDGKWKIKGKQPEIETDQKKVEELINSIASISIADYLDKSYSPQGEPEASLVYEAKQGSFTLQIWPKDGEDDDHVTKNSKSSFYAKIRSYILEDVLKSKIADFIVAKEAAAPGQEGKS